MEGKIPSRFEKGARSPSIRLDQEPRGVFTIARRGWPSAYWKKTALIPRPVSDMQDSNHALAVPSTVDAIFADRKTAKGRVKVGAKPSNFRELCQEIELVS